MTDSPSSPDTAESASDTTSASAGKLGPVGRGVVAALDRFIAHRSSGRSAAVDRSVIADLDLTHRDLGVHLPAGLSIEWLGTAGFRLEMDDTVLLIDPFLTRRSLPDTLGAAAVHSDPAIVEQFVPQADAVLVGHCHFDHAVDVPEFARRGATVYGSSSVINLLGAHGLADRSVLVDPRTAYEIGPFTVRFVPSRHSKLLAGLAVPSDGELTCDSLDALSSSAYRCGQVYGIHLSVGDSTIYHLGSADLVEEAYDLGPVDLLLCCIAGRSMTRQFTPRMLRTFDPGAVIPHHYDDFFRPFAGPMGLSLNINVAGFVDDVEAAAPGLTVRTMAPLQHHRAIS